MLRLKARLRRTTVGDIIIWSLVTTVVIVLLLVLYSLLSPFKPVDVEGYLITPQNVCPGELVGIDSELTIEDGRYTFTIDPSWTNVNNLKYVDEAYAEFPVAVGVPEATEDVNTELVYMTPTEPGEWQFSAKVDVQGRVGVLPRTQMLGVVTSDNVTTIHDCGDAYTYRQYIEEKDSGGD